MISRRQCLRAVYTQNGTKSLPTERDVGSGMWVQEVAGWGDFYTHVSFEVSPSSFRPKTDSKLAQLS